MEPLTEIRARLGKYPHARVEESLRRITVLPMDGGGFPVSFALSGSGFVVSFAGWHEQFDSPEKALDCFAFGLSENCRLKIDMRGRFAYRWTVESRRDGIWTQDSSAGLLFFPFSMRHGVMHLQNRLLPAGPSG